jgi:FKBP-type peptidyl-prolyl cis-trans isomerase
MKIGEVRELTIAPDMAYGNRQVGDLIPPGSTLVFEVELVGLKNLDL